MPISLSGSLNLSGSLTTTGTITATTLVVQTITSSISSVTGSTNFGSIVGNTHTFTGSLNVTGALAVVTTGTEFQVTNTGVNIGNALTDSHVISGSLRVNPGGLFISSSGTVGIGTTSNTAKLEIQNSPANDWGISVWGNTTVSQSYGGIVRGGTNSSDVAFRVNNAANSLTYFTVQGNGNVGIGATTITNPNGLDKLLEIKAAASVGLILNDSRDANPIGLENRGAVFHLTYGTSSILIADGASKKVGIGTNSPVEALSVSGGVYINAGAGDKTNDSAFYLVANSDADWGVTIDKSGYNYGLRTNVINSAGYGMALYDSTNASWSFRVAGNGYIYSTNTSVQSISSDINLKTDIKDYDKGLLEVLAMKPRYFKYKNNLNDELVGFIAQEMEEAMPGSMVENEIDKDVFAKSYIVDWHPLLVKAIQELTARVQYLENK